MKKHLVLLFGLFLALAFVLPSVGVAKTFGADFGPPDIVAGQVNMDDVLMDLTNPAEKGAISFNVNQLRSCLGYTQLIDIGTDTLIGFNTGPLAMFGHLGGVHSSPFG